MTLLTGKAHVNCLVTESTRLSLQIVTSKSHGILLPDLLIMDIVRSGSDQLGKFGYITEWNSQYLHGYHQVKHHILNGKRNPPPDHLIPIIILIYVHI